MVNLVNQKIQKIFLLQTHSTNKRELFYEGIQGCDYSFIRESSCEDLHRMKKYSKLATDSPVSKKKFYFFHKHFKDNMFNNILIFPDNSAVKGLMKTDAKLWI